MGTKGAPPGTLRAEMRCNREAGLVSGRCDGNINSPFVFMGLFGYYKRQMRFSILIFATMIAALAPRVLLAQVVINEVLFDPLGSDTGAEWIEIYNSDDAPADLSGWQLYPDGAGYFIFPDGFKLGAQSFATIHLRTGGDDSGSDLYHANAAGNMGNSSGSAALFAPGERGQDTIKAFLRYQKPGSSERKTWETAAADAGLWVRDAFFDISAAKEGNSIGLAADGVSAGSKNDWRVFAVPTEGLTNTATVPDAVAVVSPGVSSHATTPLYLIPRLDVLIVSRTTAIAGAPHHFEGKAFGTENKPVTGDARYVWSFGDGGVAEGKNLYHTFHFPGSYRISLDIITGAAAGSAFFDVEIRENLIRISEILTGPNGFVELSNASGETVDIGGWLIEDSAGRHFTVPANTMLRPRSFATFANETLGLSFSDSKEIVLRYGNSREAGRALVLDQSGAEASAWDGKEWKLAPPSPGAQNQASAISQASQIDESPQERTEALVASVLPSVADEIVAEVKAASGTQDVGKSQDAGQGKNTAYVFLLSAAGFGLLGGLGIAVIRRRLLH